MSTDFIAYLLQPEHMLIMLAVWAVLGLVRRIWPALDNNPIWVRLLPLIPVLACSAIVWLPYLVEGSPGHKALLGIVLGSFCGHAHKIVSQGIFGNDKRIRDHPARL